MLRMASWTALPLLLVVLVAAVFLRLDPLEPLTGSAPPVERLTFERVVLDENGIALLVRGGGSEPVRIAQVQVDGAYWAFVQKPPGALAGLGAAWLRIPYPWVSGEAHHLRLVTRTGATFEHTIEVALATPELTGDQLRLFTFIGLFVGVVPVALGMLFHPALRAGGPKAFEFALALTVGLLLFLLVDTLEEGLEIADEAAPGFQGTAIVWLSAGLTFATLTIIARRGGRTIMGVALATAIATGIGVHNFGEGLAIGAAYATGAAALGSFLVLGFMLHNITEGVGIAAPMAGGRPRLSTFALLAAVAGLPAIAGIWLGSVAYASHWAALALGIGAGAIAQVAVEVSVFLRKQSAAQGRSWISGTAFAGVALGVAVMYATALLVQV